MTGSPCDERVGASIDLVKPAAEPSAEVWVLDGLEVTIVGSIAARLTEAGSGLDREREGLRRIHPGPSGWFYSPGMIGTAGTASRYAATSDLDLDREIGDVCRALDENGPTDRDAKSINSSPTD